MKKILMIGFMCFALSATAQTGDKLKTIISVYPAGAEKNFSNEDLQTFSMMFPKLLYKTKVLESVKKEEKKPAIPPCTPYECPCKYYPPPCDKVYN